MAVVAEADEQALLLEEEAAEEALEVEAAVVVVVQLMKGRPLKLLVCCKCTLFVFALQFREFNNFASVFRRGRQIHAQCRK